MVDNPKLRPQPGDIKNEIDTGPARPDNTRPRLVDPATPSLNSAAPTSDNRHPRQRSRVGNGHKLINGCDGRGLWVRRLKDLLAEAISDMGGVDNTSAAERHIVRRACVLIVELERLERKFAQAGEATADDLDVYARISGNMRRLLESVGLQRRPRAVNGPSLSDLMRDDLRRQQQAAAVSLEIEPEESA
jgi:hypothetical protein